jgi:hypothetical protein
VSDTPTPQPDAVWRIVKMGYSSGPWRIVDSAGCQMTVYRPHPSDPEHVPGYFAPLAFDTKGEAVEELGRYAAAGAHLRERVLLFDDARRREESSVIGYCQRAMVDAAKGWGRWAALVAESDQ